jgi:NADH dehydrogenase (ubiquinone) Fe-S protein 3
MAERQSQLQSYGKYLMSIIPAVEKSEIYKDELKLHVHKEDLLPVMRILRDHTMCQFKQVEPSKVSS